MVHLCFVFYVLLTSLFISAMGQYAVETMDPTIVSITNQWSFLPGTGLPYLQRHSLVNMTYGGSTFLVAFGGMVANTSTSPQLVNSNIYLYDIAANTWTFVNCSANDTSTVPAGRYDHTAVVYNGSMYVFGGQTNDRFLNDLWRWDIGNRSWTFINGSKWTAAQPPPTTGHTTHVVGNFMLVYGGNTEYPSRTFSFTTKMWNYSFVNNTWSGVTFTSGSLPDARYLHSSALYYNMTRINPSAQDKLCQPYPCFIVYGGENGDNRVIYNDMWLFATATRAWYQLQWMTTPQSLVNIAGATARTAPVILATGRKGHQCVVILNRMQCVGGYDYTGFVDFVEYDPIFNRWLIPDFSNTPPFGLTGHRAVWVNNVLYVHGGVQAVTRNFVDVPLVVTTYKRPLCKAGWHQPDGNWMCWQCALGFAAAGGSAYICERCPAGTYSSASRDQCIQCSAGYYNTLTGQSSSAACLPCSPGTYWPTPGGTSSSCTPCPGGTYDNRNGSSLCKNCPAGYYRPVVPLFPLAVDITYCLACQAGDYSQEGATTCLPCPPGYLTTAPGQAFCMSCPLGWYTDGGLDSCTPCPQGTFSTQFATAARNVSACRNCTSGTYNNLTGQSSCALCNKGEYQDLEGQISCKPCDAGTFGNITGLSSQQCYSCPAGTYNPSVRQSQCIECPVATFSTAVGATTASVCLPCPDGTYSPLTGNDQISDCKSCPAGWWGMQLTIGMGLTQCFQCEPGTYQPNVGATSSSACLPCPAMTYAPTAGSSSCFDCPDGTYAHGGWSECVNCNDTVGEHEGWIKNGHFNLYWQGPNYDAFNKWTAETGSGIAEQSTETDMYGKTYFRPEIEYSSTTPAPTGKLTDGFLRYRITVNKQLMAYQQNASLELFNFPIVRCSLWTRAAYLNPAPGVTGIYMARFTFYQDGNTSIVNKSFTPPAGNPGLSAWVYGQVNFQPTSVLRSVRVELIIQNFLADVNAYVDWDDVAIVAEPSDVCQCIDQPGTYFDRYQIDAITEQHCIWCLPSYACRAGAKFKCAATEMSHGQSPKCMACLPGWQCTYYGASPCSYLNYLNSTDNQCYPCLPGLKCGTLEGIACWPGTYGHGGYECVLCLPGTYTDYYGAQFCYNCNPGQMSNYMRTGCQDCPPNYYSPYGEECLQCPAGTYSAQYGSTQCQSCTNVTDVVVATIKRNTVYYHINVMPDYCIGESMAQFAIANVTHIGTSQGRVSMTSPDGRSVTYFTNRGAVGSDIFLVGVESLDTDQISQVRVELTIVNTAPVAMDDYMAISSADTVGTLQPLLNDVDNENDELFIDALSWDGPTQGIVATVLSDGKTLQVTFPPTFVGYNLHLHYSVNDSLLKSANKAVVSLCRGCSPPTGVDDRYTVDQGTVAVFDVLGNDINPDLNPLTIKTVSATTKAATVTTDGSTIRYSAAVGFCGTDQFSYTATSIDGQISAKVIVQVANCMCNVPIDLMILMDDGLTTTSVGFVQEQQFIYNLANRLNFNGNLGPELGIITYSNATTIVQTLTPLLSDISTTFTVLTYSGGPNSYAAEAMQLANTHFNAAGRGSGYPRKLVLIVDDVIDSVLSPLSIANILKTATYPVAIYVVAVGLNVDFVQLQSIASSPSSQYIRPVNSYDQLNNLVVSLVDSLCDET